MNISCYTKTMKNTSILIGTVAVAVVIGAGVFFFSRGTTPEMETSYPSETPSPTATIVPFTELARGTQSTVGGRVNYIITSSDQLRELWELIGAKKRMPDVDFSKSAVAAVFAGERPTGGYGIEVSKVEDASARKITVTLTQPASDCMLTQAVTMPYQVVELPNTTLQLTHEDITTTTGCPK